MSYQRERDQFVARMGAEGLPLHVTEALLRAATTLQRYAELACSSAAADRDRVPCPGRKKLADCCCDNSGAAANNGEHDRVPRHVVREYQLEQRIKAVLETMGGHGMRGHAATMPSGWTMQTQGDPRGYVLRVISPAQMARNRAKVAEYEAAGRIGYGVGDFEAIGVPARETRIKW